MNRFTQHTVSAIVCAIASLSASMFPDSALAQYSFKGTSVLAKGKWVKVTTSAEGVYEISYDALRAMGFNSPESVGVYGTGAAPMPLSFTSADGKPQITDDLEPVAVCHADGKIYFYAEGDTRISFSANQSAPSFSRNDKNIYSRTGAYFLTDRDASPLLMQKAAIDADAAAVTKAYDYVIHENDLYHNTTSTGQIFWGESLLNNGNLEWPLDIPFLVEGSNAEMECRIYPQDNLSNIRMNFQFGLASAASGNADFTITSVPRATTFFQPLSPSRATIVTGGFPQKAFVKASGTVGDFLNIDFWILSYAKSIDDFSRSRRLQESLWIKGNQRGYYELKGPGTLRALDVSDLKHPRELTVADADGMKRVAIAPEGSYSHVVLFDSGVKQMQIVDYEPVANQNLHALAADGADLLIVTTAPLRDVADRIAAIHRSEQGLAVQVVELGEMFNEFSAGVPSPMAYRALVKMLRESAARPLRNLLLVGPLRADYRKAVHDLGLTDMHIAFQDMAVCNDSHAGNMLDFYGITSNRLKSESQLQNETISVGVGILPFNTPSEADKYLAKLADYFAEKDYSSVANKMVIVGGTGNTHMHDRQAVQMSESNIDIYAPAPLQQWPLVIDAFGQREASRKFVDELNSGTFLSYYFGHSGPQQLNGSTTNRIFTMHDATSLANRHLGFLFIGGCDMSDPDHGLRGMGESLVIDSPRGMMGVVCATRTVWSAQNFSLGKTFVRSAYCLDKSNTPRTETPTIGEVFALAKSIDTNRNSLSYLLIGDPALPLAVPLRHVSASAPGSYAPGETLTVSGSVAIDKHGSACDNSFNGFVTLRLAEPPVYVRSADYITSGQNDTVTLTVPYKTRILGEYRAKVANGRFSARVTVPKNAAQFCGDKLALYVSAYDPDKRLSANGKNSVSLATVPAEAENVDTTAPVITARYDAVYGTVEVTVSDNGSLAAGCLRAMGPQGALEPVGISGETSSECVFHIPANSLPEGKNSLSLSAVDMAGNVAETTFEFTRSASSAPLTLALASKAVADVAEFIIPDGATGLTLTVCDSRGNVVFTAPAADASVKWDCRDVSGHRVEPGLYRARLASASSEAAPYSDWTPFGVLW